MVKVKMLFRFTGLLGKMEQGLTYMVPPDYARELISHGLAESVFDRVEPPVTITVKEIGRVRSKSGRFMPKAKKR